MCGRPMRGAMPVSKAAGVLLVIVLAMTGSALGAVQDLPTVTAAPAYGDVVAYCGLAALGFDVLGPALVDQIAVAVFGLPAGWVYRFYLYCGFGGFFY